uniref:NADH dehydrogenase subunit 6 n=1 Tax=Didymobothrium rudolphii TaxID=423277 RepID=A0A8F7GN68_9CEST|nr:NADH dehydrogenase subunit 6 [Didymobothrium rudolphii]
MLVSIFFILYLLCLTLFCWVSHPVYYCMLLVINSLCCCTISYLIYGFSWYPLLFCLVYIGGVYILFVFVSVHAPNSNQLGFLSHWHILVILTAMLLCFYLWGVCDVNYPYIEYSSSLCNISEGGYYVVLCLTILFGFVVLSLITSVKGSHHR